VKRRSKEDWLGAALDVLETRGVNQVKIATLAKHLRTSRSGFYWHFRNRRDMLAQLLEYWSHVFTGVIASNPSFLEGSPEQRLVRIANTIVDQDLTRYDLAFRSWAREDAMVAREVERVYARRMEYIGSIFSQAGFRGEELAMRTRLFACYYVWEATMFWREPKSRRKKHIGSRVRLLTQK
jgi:AcrR family transcriptional regulator